MLSWKTEYLCKTHIGVEETADTKLNFKVYRNSAILEGDGLSASLVVAVALDVHHTLEIVVLQAHVHRDSVSQAVHLQVGPVEVRGSWGRCDDGN